MTIREEHDDVRWDTAIASVSHATFLQAWAWGEGQAALGKIVKRFVIEKRGQVPFFAQAIEERRYGLSYWFVPGGPIPVGEYRESGIGYREWEETVKLLKKELLHGTSVFLRFEPCIPDTRYPIPDTSWSQTSSFNPAVHWMIDLRQKTSAQLLTDMDQKTRYNVHLGERQGVTTRLSVEQEDFEIFLQLMHDTGTRNNIHVHTDEYLWTTFFALAKAARAKLRLAEYKGNVLAASIEITFGDTVTYLHGASSSTQREIKAANVLQWHAIQYAQQQGYAWYDFGGCNPIDVQHPLYKKSFEGITRFKEGWGGKRIEFLGTFVIPRFAWMRKMFKKTPRR